MDEQHKFEIGQHVVRADDPLAAVYEIVKIDQEYIYLDDLDGVEKPPMQASSLKPFEEVYAEYVTLYEEEISAWDWAGIAKDALGNAESDDGEGRRRTYLGTVFGLLPSGKYSSQDPRDEAFFEALDKVAESHEMWIEEGDDPCDVFAGIWAGEVEDGDAYTVALDGDGGHQTQAGASGASGMAYAAGSEIVVFKTAGGWMSCIRGVSVGGNAYETDDFGPFGTAAEAEAYARDYAASYNEE